MKKKVAQLGSTVMMNSHYLLSLSAFGKRTINVMSCFWAQHVMCVFKLLLSVGSVKLCHKLCPKI